MTVVALDFDATLVINDFPNIGSDVPQAFEWCRLLQDAGAQFILWTLRDGRELDEAVNHCTDRNLRFLGINRNPGQHWSTSPKQFAHLYIDDAAIGCPLTCLPDKPDKPFVDWSYVGPVALDYVNSRQRPVRHRSSYVTPSAWELPGRRMEP